MQMILLIRHLQMRASGRSPAVWSWQILLQSSNISAIFPWLSSIVTHEEYKFQTTFKTTLSHCSNWIFYAFYLIFYYHQRQHDVYQLPNKFNQYKVKLESEYPMLSVVTYFKVNTLIVKNILWKIPHPWKLVMSLFQSKERFVGILW